MESTPATSPDLLAAARCTVVFALLYAATFVNVLASKKRALRKAAAAHKDQAYDRYASLDMRPADRLQANFLEWSPAFLGLMWSLAATGRLGGRGAAVCWAYVGLRALYVVLVCRRGIR